MSTITVRYFAAAEEAAGAEQEVWALPPHSTLSWLRDALIDRYGEKMEQALRGGSFLIDGQVRRDFNAVISAAGAVNADGTFAGNQVDVLPPFAGG